jgi:hypothetical protein
MFSNGEIVAALAWATRLSGSTCVPICVHPIGTHVRCRHIVSTSARTWYPPSGWKRDAVYGGERDE